MKLTVVVEADGMDDGCVYNILQECVNHGKVIEVKMTFDDGREVDQLPIYEPLPEPQGRC